MASFFLAAVFFLHVFLHTLVSCFLSESRFIFFHCYCTRLFEGFICCIFSLLLLLIILLLLVVSQLALCTLSLSSQKKYSLVWRRAFFTLKCSSHVKVILRLQVLTFSSVPCHCGRHFDVVDFLLTRFILILIIIILYTYKYIFFYYIPFKPLITVV